MAAWERAETDVRCVASEDRLVERPVRQQSLQARVVLLERLQALCLVDRHSAVLLAPPEVLGVDDHQQFARRRHRAQLGEFDVRLTQLADELLGLKSHDSMT